jgi:hypothetical protein
MGTILSYGAAIDALTTPEFANYSYFDTPNTTSQITYKVGVNNAAYNYDWYLNSTTTDADNTSNERGTSFICVTEIAN